MQSYLIYKERASDFVTLTLFEHLHPTTKTHQTGFSIFGNTLLGLFDCLFAFEMRLGIEFIGIAYHLFLKSFGQKVRMRKRQIAPAYIVKRQTGTGVAFANTCMSGKTFGTEHGRAKNAVTYIRFVSETADIRRITAYYANIMQHCSLGYEVTVELQFRM